MKKSTKHFKLFDYLSVIHLHLISSKLYLIAFKALPKFLEFFYFYCLLSQKIL